MSNLDATTEELARQFDYWSTELPADPYPLFDRFRAECPAAVPSLQLADDRVSWKPGPNRFELRRD